MTENAGVTESGPELPVIRPLPGSAPQARPEQQVGGDQWRVTVIADGLFRIEWSADGGFEDRASTFAQSRDNGRVDFSVRRSDDAVEITTARARLRYDGQQPSAHGLLVELIGKDPGRWRYGEPTHDLGGTARTLDDVDGRTELEPGVVSPNGIALVDDSESFVFESDGWIGSRPEGRRDLYVFAYGRDYAETIRALYAVSGRPTRLPRWALGNWWSRYHAYTSDSYLELMDRFDEEGTPFSVAVIDMDWHKVDSVPERFGSGWTGYSWERRLIPDPPAFLRALHERGMRTTLNLHPADGVRAFEDVYPAIARRMGIDPATEAPVIFDPTDPAFVRAYFEEVHHPLERDGVDFWWIDWQQGRVSNRRSIDPLWLLNHFHYLDMARSGGPGMLFSRYAGPGSHRYAVGFSGDAVISWASLDFQPEFTARASNIGYCWWSHDIGGHTRGTRDDELQTRWLQFGVFSPITRLHSANNPFIRKEPWTFPAEHRRAMRDALRFRHRLVPYLHTMNYRAAAGTPLVRPMYHLEPRRPEAYTVPNEYEFGSELIVAPITEPRDPASRRGRSRAWLPEGLWTDIFTGAVYGGDRQVELHRTLETLPVLLRAGGVLPLAAETDLDATRNPCAFEVLVAPAAAGEFVLAEDSEDDRDGDLLRPAATTKLAWDPDTRQFRIGAVEGRADVVPEQRTWTITFLAGLPDGKVTVDGEPVEVTGRDGRWSITVTRPATAGAVIAVTGDRLAVGPDQTEQILQVLEEAQMGNPEKLAAWEALERDRPAVERIAALDAIELPAAVRAAIVELAGAVVEQTVGDRIPRA